jgi:hypothetical protein
MDIREKVEKMFKAGVVKVLFTTKDDGIFTSIEEAEEYSMENGFNLDTIEEWVNAPKEIDIILNAFVDEEFTTADGFDEAILGVDDRSRSIIYSISKCLGILMERDGMSEEVAEEFFSYNVLGSLGIGENAPIWCDDTYKEID